MYKFSNDEKAIMKQLYESGLSIAKIAGQFGITPSPVSRVLKELGVEIRKKSSSKEPIAEGQTKVCPVCGRDLPLDAYYKGSGKFGRQSRCKECDKAQHASEHYRELRKISRNERRLHSNRDYQKDQQTLLNNNDSYKKYMVRTAKQRASAKGVPFDIDYTDFDIPEKCPLLDIPLVKHIGQGKAYDDSPSLDRIYPELGYVKGNIWVISNKANRVKNDVGVETLQKIANRLKNKIEHDR